MFNYLVIIFGSLITVMLGVIAYNITKIKISPVMLVGSANKAADAKKKEKKEKKQSVKDNRDALYGEVWEPLEDRRILAGKYEISSFGRIYSKLTNQLLCPWMGHGGLELNFTREDGHSSSLRLVKGLVAKTFVGIPPAGARYKVICIDGDETNVKATNLKYEKINTGRKSKKRGVRL